jgi:hypothetical protein
MNKSVMIASLWAETAMQNLMKAKHPIECNIQRTCLKKIHHKIFSYLPQHICILLNITNAIHLSPIWRSYQSLNRSVNSQPLNPKVYHVRFTTTFTKALHWLTHFINIKKDIKIKLLIHNSHRRSTWI